ncbi:TPA: ParB N-terminal domain-containing protein [Pasteurella multocida]|uniref:ParB family protein n=1 Tax=Pasteurella multocida TaxID=747 RepID=UPI0010933B23|nr:ParB family protein [Pasteurella multocida]QCA32119.1 chromosome partitioning protein ParB [Pasteurella multocida]QXG51808.1 ParB N-terminal domain-containing protein [Pasteurella multocida]WGE13696.1 ParB N-terminal domain-containing protein [Pasteurella multocida]HDX0989495.1 ParB N-terminal domain-containing protein [Pasteurella multocida]HDX1014779.1 ParB N-terminal domain-containing protein [Pasteurella multocida]
MTKNEKRAAAIARNLNVSPIANVSPSYQTVTPSHYSSEVEYITVTLDKLRPYEHNPRKTRNPNFEMIKESIRRRGLDHKPNITRRPGEDFYIIADGGNTRIQALKELFTETKDPKFWSISCEYKPWQGDSADSVEAELNILIGHLIENDTRADLSFIEKALGILQAKEYYEKKLEKSLSARELSTELEKDGYIISFSLITKMERCVAYLYPYIPDVLFKGLGHTQIDKLLAIRNNADEVWHHYHLEVDTPFEKIWASSLTSCNEDVPFQARDFQDKLITQMADLLEGKTTYESLYLEIDLDERKFKKIAAKQHEIENHVEHSIEQITQHQETVKTKPVIPKDIEKNASTENHSVVTPTTPSSLNENETEHSDEDVTSQVMSFFDETNDSTIETNEDVNSELLTQISQGFGLTPGMSIQEQREKRAIENGLSFACCGRQPVEDIWQIYPARNYRSEAYSLALDIAETANIEDLVEHVIKTPVDYSYRMKPSNGSLSSYATFIYHLLSMLQTNDFSQSTSCTLESHFLFNQQLNSGIDDITLVKIFRLIRVVRHLRQGAQP